MNGLSFRWVKQLFWINNSSDNTLWLLIRFCGIHMTESVVASAHATFLDNELNYTFEITATSPGSQWANNSVWEDILVLPITSQLCRLMVIPKRASYIHLNFPVVPLCDPLWEDILVILHYFPVVPRNDYLWEDILVVPHSFPVVSLYDSMWEDILFISHNFPVVSLNDSLWEDTLVIPHDFPSVSLNDSLWEDTLVIPHNIPVVSLNDYLWEDILVIPHNFPVVSLNGSLWVDSLVS